jgi:DNA (cytosine-5)-methyltransferase 1
VAGALSSNAGRDFHTVIDQMAEAGAHLQEYALLDSQFFGIPQRRRRVFLLSVFHSDIADRCADPLLPVSESMRRDTSQGKSQGQATARSTTDSTGSDSEPDDTIVIDRAMFNAGANAQYQGIISEEPLSPTLTSRGPHAVYTSLKYQSVQTEPIFSFDTQFGSNANVFADQSPTLKASQASPSVMIQTTTNDNGVIRRLLPIETERLMGWPDDHTRWRADETEQADTHRYKQCGNGVVSPVATWIGEQIRVYL